MVNNNTKEEIKMEYLKNLLKKSGWVSIVESLIFAILGIILIWKPNGIMNIISYIIGAIFIVVGVIKILNYFQSNGKNNLFNYGLKDGITKTIDDAIDLGKSAVGMVTGNFENVAQMQSIVKSGGLIEGISSLIDTVLNKVKYSGALDNNVINIIKQGKNLILNNVESNIERNFNKQYEAIENMDKYINKWKDYYQNQDFNGMEKEYKKLEKQIKDIAPIEKTINEAKTIEVLHNLIKNNGQNFDLSSEELELVEKLKNL